MIGMTRSGPSGAPKITFLHGGVINRHMWDPVIDRLDSRFDCIALDLPGHGDHDDRELTITGATESCWTALDRLGVERTALVGLSLGGYIAQTMSAAQPGRVSGLLVSGATIRYTGRDAWSTRLFGYVFPIAARPAMNAFARKMREDLGDDLADDILAGGLSSRGGAQALRRLPGTDYAALLSGYNGPVVIVNGERDSDNREAESLFTAHVPRARVVTIENAGHACALQQPAAFATAVTELMALAVT